MVRRNAELQNLVQQQEKADEVVKKRDDMIQVCIITLLPEASLNGRIIS